MSRSAKINVRCPHCGHEQSEPRIAKSTYCRACSEYFTIEHALRAARAAQPPTRIVIPEAEQLTRGSGTVPLDAPTLREPDEIPKPGAAQPSTTLSHLRFKFGQYFRGPNSLLVRCFECGGEHEVAAAAQSATCRHCGAYVDLQNYKINGSFSREIKTCGSLLVLARADLASSKVICGSATIYGKVRANLYSSGDVAVRYEGKIYGEMEGRNLHVEKGANVEFVRPLKFASAEIDGRMSGQLLSDGHVVIRRNGHLSGSVTAKAFTVEQGGGFDGEMTISPNETFESALQFPESATDATKQPELPGLDTGNAAPENA